MARHKTGQIALGNPGEVFTWMEKCYQTHSAAMTSLKVNPDELRRDPRFAKVLPQVGLSN